MRFGLVPLSEAEGAILAHAVNAKGRRLAKGRMLSAEDVAVLAAAGIASPAEGGGPRRLAYPSTQRATESERPRATSASAAIGP